MSCFPKECGHTPGILKEFPIQMKRTFALAVLLASGLALNAAAQTPAAPAPAGAAPAAAPAAVTPIPAKVAVIAFQVAVAQTNEGQRNFADVTKKFEPKRAQLKALNDEVEGMKKQLQAQGDKLSPAESASRTKAIDDKSKQLQRQAEDAQNDFQTEVQDMYNALASKVFEVVDAYAKQQGYTLVLDASNQQSPILWASEATNITLPVISAYNAKSGVPAPPAAAPSAPAPAGAKAPAPRRAPSTTTPPPQ
jgi:outer membrane protein